MSDSWVGLAEMRLLAVCGCREPSLEADRFATAARLASGGGMLPALRPINQQIHHLPVADFGFVPSDRVARLAAALRC